ncbi:MAG: DUF2459 domain-containing protein [Gammaproteobacteria bacterium]|nr:DUF2459 domain-containing protein [Gammaproteobacteria bacterium]
MMSDIINRLLLLCVLTLTILCSGCATSIKGACSLDAREPAKLIYLVSHGWHVGIVVNRIDIPDDVRLVHKEFSNTDYLEIGWGDRDFYQMPIPDLENALKAVLLPTPSVLHIVAFNDPVVSHFPHSEIISVRLSDAGFQRMIRYIAASYVRDPVGNPAPLGVGLYGTSQFYRSHETYHLFRTCNVWVARALDTAGCPVRPFLAITGDNLMSQALSFGTLLRDKPSDD